MKKITGMMLGVVALFAAEAPAQIVGDNIGSDLQAVWNTASANTMALRAPGNLVSLGRADFAAAHSLAINRSRFGPTVTEPAPTGLTVEQQVRVDVINELFTNVNAALLALLNAHPGQRRADPDRTRIEWPDRSAGEHQRRGLAVVVEPGEIVGSGGVLRMNIGFLAG
jgi:hypothetical protein